MTQNPYWGSDFFSFFAILFSRVQEFFVLGPSQMQLASDELQLFVLTLISISSALIGTFLVLRKMAMLANALSHTILPGVVFAYLGYHYFYASPNEIDFSHLLPSDSLLVVAGLASGLVTAYLTQTLVQHLHQAEDASIGMVFTFLFAIGIILVTAFTKSSHVGAELLMGNVDALHRADLSLIFWIFVANLTIFALLWRPFFVSTFDPLFSSMCGISNAAIGYLLMGQVAVCAIGAFRAVGVLLFLAFLVTPPLIARKCTHNLKVMAGFACLVGALSSLIGVAFSRHLLSVYALPCSTSGLIVTLLAIVYGFSLAIISRPRA